MVEEPSPPFRIRSAQWPQDVDEIMALDASFTTDVVLDVEADAEGFRLVPRRLASPLVKRFPLDDLGARARSWDAALVAVGEGRIAGVLSAELQAWNRRLVLSHFYVVPRWRRHGVGRALVAEAAAQGAALGARRLWAEASNINVPGLEAYRALGFRLCGLDASLYRDTSAEGEIALFLTCDI